MIRIKSANAKRTFANHIKADYPMMLEFIIQVGKTFGPLEEIEYSGTDEEELRAKLVAGRSEVIQ